MQKYFTTFGKYFFLQKSSFMDISQGPKYAYALFFFFDWLKPCLRRTLWSETIFGKLNNFENHEI